MKKASVKRTGILALAMVLLCIEAGWLHSRPQATDLTGTWSGTTRVSGVRALPS